MKTHFGFIGLVGLVGLIGLIGLPAAGQTNTNCTPVRISLMTLTGSAQNRQVVLTAKDSPLRQGNTIVWSPPVIAQPTNGVATVCLVPDDYYLRVAGLPGVLLISVYAATNVLEVVDLTTNLVTYRYTNATAGLQWAATSDMDLAGHSLVGADSLSGSNLVIAGKVNAIDISAPANPTFFAHTTGYAGVPARDSFLRYMGALGGWWFYDYLSGTNASVRVGPLFADSISVAGADGATGKLFTGTNVATSKAVMSQDTGFAGEGGLVTNLNGAAIQPGTVSRTALDGATAAQLQGVYDTNAIAYAQSVGLTDLDGLRRVNGFVLALKSAGLWTGMDGILLRTNFNPGTLRTLAGRYATNSGGVSVDGAGAHFDGVNGYSVVPATIGISNTMLFIYAGDPGQNPSIGSATPFGLFNTGGTNAGAIYPLDNGPTVAQMRWAISGNGTGESSSVSTGWFANIVGDTYLIGTDFRQHVWAMTWNNAGGMTSFLDGVSNLTASGFATVLTNGALNSIVLGARLNNAGAAEGFFKAHVQAALVWPRVLSLSEMQLARQAIQWLLPGESRQMWIGDSMSYFGGPNPDYPWVTGTEAAHYWPSILYGADAFGAKLGTPQYSEFTPISIAWSGLGAEHFTPAVISAQLGPYGVGGPVKSEWVNVWIGINNLGGGMSGADVFSYVTNIWGTCRQILGAKVRAFTLPGVGSEATNHFLAGYFTNAVARSNFNVLVRAAHTQYDDLVDLDAAFPSSMMETNVGNSYDGLHMTAAGQTNMVAQIKAPFRAGTYYGAFVGNGPGLTNLNASALSSGTVPGARLNGASNNVIALSAGSANTLVITNGNVGIGTTAPTEKLSVYGTLNSAPGIISLESSRNDDGNVEVGRISGKNTTIEGSRISFYRSGDAYVGYLTFSTSPTNYAAVIERMKIDSTGNVGIGTTSPAVLLDINKLATEQMIRVKSPVDSLYYMSLGLAGNARGLVQSPYGLDFTTTANAGIAGYNGTMTFTTVAGGGGFNFINGNVGIGTTSPASKLSVNGDIGATSLIVTNNATVGGGRIMFSGVTQSNPPTSGSGTAFLFSATNSAGTAEIFTMDGAGVIKQISEHAMDAPPQMIDDDDEAPNISKEILMYTGKVRWINRSRAARLQERMLTVTLNSMANWCFLQGKTAAQWSNSAAFGQYTNQLVYLDSLNITNKDMVMVESFTKYNTRLGLTNGNGLVKAHWGADQDRFAAEYVIAFTNVWNSYTASLASYQTNVLTNTNAVAPVAPEWNPPTRQAIPGWLNARGAD